MNDEFLDKALKGFAMFALNEGEAAPVRAVRWCEESIYDKFRERAVARTKKSSRATRST